VFIGNGLEFYDFCSYGLFAVYIGRTFFPSTDGSLSLLLSLATFGIGFVFRPIGGIVLGTLGDRIGRKPAMLISFGLMGVGPFYDRFRPQCWQARSGSLLARESGGYKLT